MNEESVLAPSQWHSLQSNFKIMAHSLRSIAQQQSSKGDVLESESPLCWGWGLGTTCHPSVELYQLQSP